MGNLLCSLPLQEWMKLIPMTDVIDTGPSCLVSQGSDWLHGLAPGPSTSSVPS
jgi:hypothetical protein